MSKITVDDVKKLAKLSRIALTEEEITKYQSELASIIEYVKMLDAIDTDGVTPTAQVTGLENVTRKDEVDTAGLSTEELLANAPDQIAQYIKVKRVLE